MRLKNFLGEVGESLVSDRFHKQGVPLLVSPVFLRQRGCGQIDVARFINKGVGQWHLEVAEVKCGEREEVLPHRQKQRLRKSVSLLSSLFQVISASLMLIRVKKSLPKSPEHLSFKV